MKKNVVKERVGVSSSRCVTDKKTLRELLDCIQILIEEFGEDSCIEFDSGYNNICETIYHDVEREETDAEYARRVKSEKRKMDREREEYERLKKKFEEKK